MDSEINKTNLEEIIMAKKYDITVKNKYIAARLPGGTVKSINAEFDLEIVILKNLMSEYYEAT